MATRTSIVLNKVEHTLKNNKNYTSIQALNDVIRKNNFQFSTKDYNALLDMINTNN